jgi:hypothetical protein
MNTRTKDAALLAVIMIIGLAMIGDLHRTFFRWLFPIITDYLDWLVR